MSKIEITTQPTLDGYIIENTKPIMCRKSFYGRTEDEFPGFFNGIVEYMKLMADDNKRDTVVDFKLACKDGSLHVFTATIGNRKEKK